MSLVRITRRRRQSASPDKPQLERIEHANLDRPGARLHPRAEVNEGVHPGRESGGARPSGAATAALTRPRSCQTPCQTERPGA